MLWWIVCAYRIHQESSGSPTMRDQRLNASAVKYIVFSCRTGALSWYSQCPSCWSSVATVWRSLLDTSSTWNWRFDGLLSASPALCCTSCLTQSRCVLRRICITTGVVQTTEHNVFTFEIITRYTRCCFLLSTRKFYFAPVAMSMSLCLYVSSSRHCLRSVNRNQLAVPPVKLSTYGGRCFGVLPGPTIWNSLPSYLRDPTLSLGVFRRYLKTYLFARY